MHWATFVSKFQMILKVWQWPLSRITRALFNEKKSLNLKTFDPLNPTLNSQYFQESQFPKWECTFKVLKGLPLILNHFHFVLMNVAPSLAWSCLKLALNLILIKPLVCLHLGKGIYLSFPWVDHMAKLRSVQKSLLQIWHSNCFDFSIEHMPTRLRSNYMTLEKINKIK
jgi:hypothetical protein